MNRYTYEIVRGTQKYRLIVVASTEEAAEAQVKVIEPKWSNAKLVDQKVGDFKHEETLQFHRHAINPKNKDGKYIPRLGTH